MKIENSFSISASKWPYPLLILGMLLFLFLTTSSLNKISVDPIGSACGLIVAICGIYLFVTSLLLKYKKIIENKINESTINSSGGCGTLSDNEVGVTLSKTSVLRAMISKIIVYFFAFIITLLIIKPSILFIIMGFSLIAVCITLAVKMSSEINYIYLSKSGMRGRNSLQQEVRILWSESISIKLLNQSTAGTEVVQIESETGNEILIPALLRNENKFRLMIDQFAPSGHELKSYFIK